MINYHYIEEIHNKRAALQVLPYLFDIIKPKSVIDIGCGTGTWLKVASDLNVKKILGIDGTSVDSNPLEISHDYYIEHDLNKFIQIQERFDLAICLEVVEHLPDTAADNVISILTNSSDVVLFSAAIPNQGGQNHINEQWPKYWIQKFSSKGFLLYDILRHKFWENTDVEWWYRQNMYIFAKKEFGSKYGFYITENPKMYIHPDQFLNKVSELDELCKLATIEKELSNSLNDSSFYHFKNLVQTFKCKWKKVFQL